MDTFFSSPDQSDNRAELDKQPAHFSTTPDSQSPPTATRSSVSLKRTLFGFLVAALVTVGLGLSVWSVSLNQEVRQQASGVQPVVENQEKEKRQFGTPTPANPQVDPGAPPMAPDAIVAKALVIAWGGRDEPVPPSPYHLTNDELIPWVEHLLERGSIFGGWDPIAGDVARVNIQFPYNRVQFTNTIENPAIPPTTNGTDVDYYTIITSTGPVTVAGRSYTFTPVPGQSICQLVAQDLIDEVWLVHNEQNTAYSFKKSIMAGQVYDHMNPPQDNRAFPIGPTLVIPNTGTVCPTAFHLTAIPYFYTTAEPRPGPWWPQNEVNNLRPSLNRIMYNFATRFQYTAAYFLDNNPTYGTSGWYGDDGFNDMIAFDRTFGYGVFFPSPTPLPWTPPRSCGNVDFPPNAHSWGWGSYYNELAQNANYKTRSDCTSDRTTWNPQHTYVPASPNVDCWNWSCWQEKYHLWWMQHFPNKTNTYCKLDNSAMPDWWEMMYKNREIPGAGGTNCPVAPSPSPSPTPLPSTTLTGVSTLCTPTRNLLSWTSVTGATQYQIRRCTGSTCEVTLTTPVLATVNSPTLTYTDSAVATSTTYKYKVRGISASNSGPLSNQVSMLTGSCLPSPSPSPSGSPLMQCGQGCAEQFSMLCAPPYVCDHTQGNPPMTTFGICVNPNNCPGGVCTCP